MSVLNNNEILKMLREDILHLYTNNKEEHNRLMDLILATKNEFTIFKWKVVGMSTAAATILAVIIKVIL